MTTTETNLSKLTPEEFSELYMNGLKNELGVYDLQANKVGFLGFLVNMLGNITYDAKIYKDFLFFHIKLINTMIHLKYFTL